MVVNNIHIILFLMACMISSSEAQADNSKIQSLVGSITELDNSSNVVLSIDCSGSMVNESAKNAALGFLDQLKDRTKGNINVGYVAWSKGILAESPTLSPGISDIYNEINNSNLKNDSVTCMRIGLDKSIRLLRDNGGPGKHNILIVISDGMDNCTPDTNLNCGDIWQKLNATGIKIFTIPIGNYSEGRKLLGCLENSGYVPGADAGNTQGFREVKNLSRDLVFKAEVNNDNDRNPYTNPTTNMTISKKVTWGDYGPRIILTIKAPDIKNITTNIVIAVDSSGSLGLGGRVEYGDSVRESMPYALNLIRENNQYSNVSIISWDDNIDFEYGLAPISDVIDTISKNNVFMNEVDRYPFPLNYLLKYIFRIQYNENNAYYCKETESTNLSVGLDRARIVLNNSIKNGNGIRKQIILITARSEFTPCNQTIIDLARSQNCSIYTIGIGVASESLLENELKNKLASDPTKYHYSAGSGFYTNSVLATVIKDVIEQSNTDYISNSLTIEDTLYPYIHARNDTIVATVNHTRVGVKMVPSKYNSDNTTTWKIILDGNLNIKPMDEIEVSFDTVLNMSLPIDATRSRTSIAYSIDQETPRSLISYRWLGDNHIYKDPLPECSIEI